MYFPRRYPAAVSYTHLDVYKRQPVFSLYSFFIAVVCEVDAICGLFGCYLIIYKAKLRHQMCIRDSIPSCHMTFPRFSHHDCRYPPYIPYHHRLHDKNVHHHSHRISVSYTHLDVYKRQQHDTKHIKYVEFFSE